MGHEIMDLTFDSSKTKNAIIKYCSRIVEEDSDEDSLDGIEFIDYMLFDSKKEAKEYIRENAKGWYPCMAVKYRVPKPSKYLQGLKEKRDKAISKYTSVSRDLRGDIFFGEEAYIKCRHCKEYIDREDLEDVICPNCGNNLMSKANIERLEKLKEKALKYKKEYSDEYKRLKFKSDDFNWLVQIEYRI